MNAIHKTALITGGTGNLGRTVTRRFLAEGYRVALPWHSQESWNELRQSLDPEHRARCLGLEADLTREQEVERAVKTARERFGGLGALLNLVGGFAFGDNLWETDLGTWQKMLSLNLTTVFLCCRHAVPLMLEDGWGRIVNVSSKACLDIQAGSGAYAVAKGGVITLTRALREELKGHDITVNAVMPGIIDTPVTRRIMPDGDPERWVKPGEIADLLLALCTEETAALSGSTLKVFGAL